MRCTTAWQLVLLLSNITLMMPGQFCLFGWAVTSHVQFRLQRVKT